MIRDGIPTLVWCHVGGRETIRLHTDGDIERIITSTVCATNKGLVKDHHVTWRNSTGLEYVTFTSSGHILRRPAEDQDADAAMRPDGAGQDKSDTKKSGGARAGGCKGCKGSWLKRLAKGGISLLKSELGVDAAPDELVAARRSRCEPCEAWEHGVCTDCGCFTFAKSTINSEQCPRGYWPTLEGAAVKS